MTRDIEDFQRAVVHEAKHHVHEVALQSSILSAFEVEFLKRLLQRIQKKNKFVP